MGLTSKFVSFWQQLFGDSVRAFGTVSLVLLISLAIAPAKNHFSEWRHYQKQYLKMIRGRGEPVTLQRHFQGDIQQVWLPELGVVDRCTTCHVGLKEASLVDVSTQPFRKHPVIPHSLDQFGCVMCHRGQGPATTVQEAHRSTLAWEQPVLPAKYIESSCGQCHRWELTGTPTLNEGRHLLTANGCVHCHTVKLPDGTTMKATSALAASTCCLFSAPGLRRENSVLRGTMSLIVSSSTPTQSPTAGSTPRALARLAIAPSWIR